MKKVTIYCDGSCSPETQKGAFASILICGENKQIILGTQIKTTSNRMEIIAAIKGLNSLTAPSEVTIFSDSLLLINTMNRKCRKRQNRDLWRQLDRLSLIHKIKWIWVKRNSTIGNKEADKLAKKTMKNYEPIKLKTISSSH
jgi:ribonuclease HI